MNLSTAMDTRSCASSPSWQRPPPTISRRTWPSSSNPILSRSFQGVPSPHILSRFSFLPRGAASAAPVATSSSPHLKRDSWNRTYYPPGADTRFGEWVVIDAADQVLGRVAGLAAVRLRGKDRPTFTPSMPMGSHVIVVNAAQVRVTGHKETQKTYFRHTTGRPGAWHVERLCDLRRRLPCRIVERAVRGMLPHNRMGRFLFTRLKVYAGPEHPHASQSPVDITRDVDALKARAEETKKGVEQVSLDDALAASLAPLQFDEARGR